MRKLTPQRDAVFQVILNREDHPTAGEIFEAAKLRLPSISYATVYNSLRYLRDAGLVHEIKFGDSSSRYDRETDRHDHAICNNCGKLVDFDLPQTAQSDAGGSPKVAVQSRISSSNLERPLRRLSQELEQEEISLNSTTNLEDT